MEAGRTATRHRPMDELSGGERRRAVLAQALARTRRSCCWTSRPRTWTSATWTTPSVIRRLAAERGVAVVAVLHDLTLAAALSDRLVAMAAGEVWRTGSPRRSSRDRRCSGRSTG